LAAVNDNISDWQGDIANVNRFLDNAASGTQSGSALAASASALLVNAPGNAADEPNRLMALNGLLNPNDAPAAAAAEQLMIIFQGVLTNLTEITTVRMRLMLSTLLLGRSTA